MADRADHLVAFAALLDDPDPGVRHAAATTFGLLGPGERAGHVEKLAGVFEHHAAAIMAAQIAPARPAPVPGAGAGLAEVAGAVVASVGAVAMQISQHMTQHIPPDSARWMPTAVPAEQQAAAAAVGGAVVAFGAAAIGVSAVLHALGK